MIRHAIMRVADMPVWVFVVWMIAITTQCLVPRAVLAASSRPQPNIVVVLADDMGWGDSRTYNPNSRIVMPNLEQLAAEGMRFTDAHTAASMCAPTRYSILAGNYHWRGRQSWGQWGYFGPSQLLSNQRSVADILHDAGYNTAIVGKLHMGGQFYRKGSDEIVQYNDSEDQIDFARPFFDGPLDYGFNYSFPLLEGIQASPYAYFENDQIVGDPDDVMLWTRGDHGNSTILHDGLGMPYWNSSEVGPTLTQKALDFIDGHHQANLAQGTDTPFFLYYASQAAHLPFTPPDSFLEEPVKGVTGIGDHADMIYELDVALGKLIDALELRGLLQDTLIIFTDDNGGHRVNAPNHDSMGGLRGAKGDIWEGGHRVPFIAKWGDGSAAGSTIPPGTTSNQLVGMHDLMATLAALVGESLPAGQARDSFNILPILLGNIGDETPVRDHLIMESPTEAFVSGIRQFAFRQADFKLVFDENLLVEGLYDLATDLAESNNLVADINQIARIAQMQADFTGLMALDRTAPLSDIDSDGVIDDLDNCLQVANGPLNLDVGGNSQRDTNADGFGNLCDPDLDNNGTVNFADYALLAAAFLATPGASNWNPDADLNGDDLVNFSDTALFPDFFLMPPGPSGLTP